MRSIIVILFLIGCSSNQGLFERQIDEQKQQIESLQNALKQDKHRIINLQTQKNNYRKMYIRLVQSKRQEEESISTVKQTITKTICVGEEGLLEETCINFLVEQQ